MNSRRFTETPFVLFLAALLACFPLVGCVPETPETARRYVEIQEAFDRADALPESQQAAEYRHIATRYQNLIDQGVQNGEIHYNQGNACAKAGEPGRALAAYDLAKRYLPLNSYVDQNIHTVLAGALPQSPSVPVVEYFFFWQNWIGYPQKRLVSAGFGVLTLLLGVVCLFWRHRRWRRAALCLFALTLVASASTLYDWYRFDLTEYALVAVEGVEPRKGNSASYEPVFTTSVPLGTRGVLLDRRGDWVRIRFAVGREGWLPKEQVVLY